MKQLKKLGSQESRMLTDDQMKNVTGGDLMPIAGCTPYGQSKFCIGNSMCQRIEGNQVVSGTCSHNCVCEGDAPGPILPGVIGPGDRKPVIINPGLLEKV